MDRRELLQHALEGIEHKRKELFMLSRAITDELMGLGATHKHSGRPEKVVETVHSNGIKRKYKRSASARKRMADAQRLRWAKSKKSKVA